MKCTQTSGRVFKLILTVCVASKIPAWELPVPAAAAGQPEVYCVDPAALAKAKAGLAGGDQTLQPAFRALFAEAKQALGTRTPSVMDKTRIPPSGDKHDFMSQAPYFWPDTNVPGHYVHRDGERNPAAGRDSDAGRLGMVCANVHTLALAFYFTGGEKYAAKASDFLHAWFLNPTTRMNPNLNFGQGIPGEIEGRPEGLISARGMVGMIDALGLLAESKSWTPADQQAMTIWLRQYFDWLTTNAIALGEGRARNNHGTFYDTQVAAIALFLGKTNLARELLLKDREERIAGQIEPDGRQPRELARTLSFNYSLFNLRALVDLASIGQNAGVDLWHYQAADGRSILKALEFMAPYADPAKDWPYRQIHEPNRDELGGLLLRAAAVYPESDLAAGLKFYRSDKLAANPVRLMYKTAPLDLAGGTQKK